MKELSIEEKAKAYDEAVERANSLLSGNQLGNAWIYKLLPELADSEDERIRKCITLLVNGLTNEHFVRCGASLDEIKVWLEKQGEHANFRYKIQVGDKVTRNKDGFLVNLSQLNRIAKSTNEEQKDILEDAILDGNEDGLIAETIRYKKEKQGEQKSEEEVDNLHNYLYGEQKSTWSWSEEDEEIYKKVETAINSYYAPFSRDVEEISEWFKNLKNRVKSQPK